MVGDTVLKEGGGGWEKGGERGEGGGGCIKTRNEEVALLSKEMDYTLRRLRKIERNTTEDKHGKRSTWMWQLPAIPPSSAGHGAEQEAAKGLAELAGNWQTSNG